MAPYLILLLAEDAGLEPVHRLPDDALAGRWINHSPNLPQWRKRRDSNSEDFYIQRFSGPPDYQLSHTSTNTDEGYCSTINYLQGPLTQANWSSIPDSNW